MKRILRLNQGIIGGEDKDKLVEILPQLENSFRRRKQYYEFYFDSAEVDLSFEDIEKLSDEFTIVLDFGELIISL